VPSRVAFVAVPVKFAVIVPALKFPLSPLSTIVPDVLTDVAPCALFKLLCVEILATTLSVLGIVLELAVVVAPLITAVPSILVFIVGLVNVLFVNV